MGFRIGYYRVHITNRWRTFGFMDVVLIGTGIYYSKYKEHAYLTVTLINITFCIAWDPL